MIVTRMLVPKKEPDCPELYFRGDAEAVDEREYRIKPQGTVTLDTYFNALFYGAYIRHSRAETVTLRIIISGAAELAWIVTDSNGKDTVLEEKQSQGTRTEQRFGPAQLSELPSDGMLYLSIHAKDGEVRLHEADYETQAEAAPVMLAAVICTYKRESYVLRNLDRIRRGIREREPELSSHLDVLVVDNGSSLSLPPEPQTLLLPGKNCGGSGGFTRGLMTAWLSGRYTHVLLMDDDIVFEPEIMARTIRFLQIADQHDRPLCIGGHMLIENNPTVQYEAGSDYVHGFLRPNGRGMNLAKREALMKNASQKPGRFNAWWYCCFPVSVVDQIGLPLPLFIKCDDVEYGLRMQPDLVLINGIGVWHAAFAEKYSPHLEYYGKRNELLVSVLHRSGDGVLPSAIKLVGCCIHSFQRKQRSRIDFALWGYGDFLKGPELLLNTDPEALNTDLLAQRKALEANGTGLWKQLGGVLAMLFRLVFSYGSARNAFRTRIKELTSVSFWCKYLSVDADGSFPFNQPDEGKAGECG